MTVFKTCILVLFLTGFVAEAKLEKKFMNNYYVTETEKILTGHDVVTATINGVTGKFVLDTGAVTVINDQLIEKYDLKNKLSTFDAAGAAGPIQVSYYAVDSLIIGESLLNIEQIGVTDLNQVIGGIYRVASVKVDGIIGQDVLVKSQAVININENTISFPKNQSIVTESLATYLSDEGFQSFDLIPLNFIKFGFIFHAINLEINGTKKLFILDSGASRTMINKASLDSFNFKNNKGLVSGTSGAGGSFTIESLNIEKLKIDNNEVNVDVVYGVNISPLIDFIKKEASTVVYGVIGQDVLAPLNAIIHSGDDKLYLKF